MRTHKIKVKHFKVDAEGKMENKPITGRHYDWLIMDDLVAGASATNTSPEFVKSQKAFAKILASGVKYYFNQWLTSKTAWWVDEPDKPKLTKEEMAKQVELYKNVIETKFGVKLCVKSNINSDMITMELLVPQKLFADDGGRESLADALQNIAMFILNMDNPSL